MTVLKYLMGSGVCSTAEILTLKRTSPADFEGLLKLAREEMTHSNIPIDDDLRKV